MAYVSSSGPLQGLPPAPASQLSDARIEATKRAINQGRSRIYGNTPALESFFSFGPRAAANAMEMLSRSDVARQSIFSGSDDVAPDTSQPVVSAPIVVPLNGTPEQISGGLQPSPVRSLAAPSATMPARAPSGLTGYSPPWADALARPGGNGGAGDGGSSWWKWALVIGGVLLVAGAASDKKGRR
jgi:hypothetical protein